MVAAVFSSKRYLESIQILSDSISFLQQNSILKLPDQGTITLEPVTISMQELSNIWSILGGHYYPSILCKARIISFDGTEINGKGPEISEEAVQALLDRLDQVEEGDVLVLAGSIPESMPSTFYAEILSRMQGRGILTVVDATNNLLLEVLQYRPFLVKPNQHELGEIFGVKLETQEDVIPYAGELQEKGAVNVLVSMGSKGAVLLDEQGEVHRLPAPEEIDQCGWSR